MKKTTKFIIVLTIIEIIFYFIGYSLKFFSEPPSGYIDGTYIRVGGNGFYWINFYAFFLIIRPLAYLAVIKIITCLVDILKNKFIKIPLSGILVSVLNPFIFGQNLKQGISIVLLMISSFIFFYFLTKEKSIGSIISTKK